MENTPRANRVHIGIFGRCNTGKSSLVNAITGQHVAVVSDVAGTTTDPVAKSMELPALGAVTFIDTAGFDDSGKLGAERMEQTRKAADKSDIAVVVFSPENTDTAEEAKWIAAFRQKGLPVVAVLNKSDTAADIENMSRLIEDETGISPLPVSSVTGEGIYDLIEAIARAGADIANHTTITGNLVAEGDVVMLVMPQDAQAPSGRLILPQVQTIRELLDKNCMVVSCVPDGMEKALKSLAEQPKLIITDSQVFDAVSRMTPERSMLTSFSVLMAHYKGDIKAFVEGAAAIGRLTETSHVLIAEACTHAPATEDIGRVKIPRMLRNKIGEKLTVDVVSGSDFPKDLSGYDLIIHCGACMFNRRHVLSRIASAVEHNVPITNYGITIAYLTGILDRVVYPEQ